jgi:cytoskeletal protein RodZ
MAKADVNIVVVVLAALLLIGGLTYALKQSPANRSPTNSESSAMPTSAASSSNQNTNPNSQTAIPKPTTVPLNLSIVEPKNRAVVNNSNLKVSGKTVASAEVFVNDKELTADSAGNFSTTITLDEGDNSVIVSANDDNGNYAEQELTITYEP